jgi:hypothetical protein
MLLAHSIGPGRTASRMSVRLDADRFSLNGLDQLACGLVFRWACGVKKFDLAGTAVRVIAAEPVQTARWADAFAVPAPMWGCPCARPWRR